MASTPNIDVASSDKDLGQRFRRPKSNLVIYLIVGVLGVALVATPFLLSGKKNQENDKQQASDNQESKQPVAQLVKTTFDAELMSGEVATFELGSSLKNADLSKCTIEWNVPESSIPQTVLEKVTVDDQVTVSIPTLGLENQKSQASVAEKSVGNLNQWKLVGKILTGDSTGEFTINLKVKYLNTPPVANVPASHDFDPVLGTDIKFSISDQESTSDQLTARLEVDKDHVSEFKIVDSKLQSTIEFRPSSLIQKPMVIKLEVQDDEGAAANYTISLEPKSQTNISRLVEQLTKETGLEVTRAEVNRLGNIVRLTFDLGGESLELIESRNGNSLAGNAVPKLQAGRTQFRKDSLVAICSSSNDKLTAALARQLGARLKPVAPVMTTKKAVANASLLATANKLLEDKKLFNNKSFAELVFAFVDDFERENAEVLDRKFGELEGLKEFLDDQKGLKAELFLAIDPTYDNLASVLNVLNEIRKAHPKQIIPYKNLAIAIAVCWDVPNSNYSFVGHQRRTKSILPEKLTSAVDNFRHFVTYQNQMQGRAQWLPWEFLVHVINHQTPDTDKYWALDNYISLRPQFGKCYKDVPYDYEMLNTGSQVCKLNGKEYTLSNIRAYGGVCAMQADFAARVGKSLGVPAEYVGGKSASGDNHAWVMWVEIKNVTRSGIAFSLESFGRYRGDHYYVGNLKDPKSGQRITDRQLELRLHTVGTDAYAKRHVDLLMKVYPQLVDTREMELKEQLKFLEQAIKLCAWHEGAWNEVANLIANNEIDRKMHRQMNQILNSMFVQFAAFPDFTWTIFDRLVSFVPKDEDRNKYYVKLLNLYVAAQRPDLACEAQLKLTDDLEKQEQTQVAMQGLAVTIKTFPNEGRYVPRLLDRLEKLVGDDPERIKQLVQFHVEFLPLVPQKRGNRASKYCIQMYQRAIQFFTKHRATAFADLYKAKLQELNALPK